MFLISSLRRRMVSRSLIAAVVCVGCLGGLVATASAATTDLATYTLSPASLQAGGDPSITATFTFQYASATPDSVKDITAVLPPGLNASLVGVTAQCTSAELSSFTCPAGSEIGTGTATLTDGTTTADATLYLIAAPGADDIAGVGAVFDAPGSSTPAASASGPIAFAANSSGSPVLELSIEGLPSTTQLGGEGIKTLAVTFNGTGPSGQPLTRMPSSCATATSTASIDTQNGDTGSGSSSFTPTGCSSLPYAPKFAAAAAVSSPTGGGASVTTVVTQAADEAGSKTVTLSVPDNLTTNVTAATTQICTAPNTTFSNCDKVGSAVAVSPLLPSTDKLTGAVYLTGSLTAANLTIVFPEPFPLILTGAVNIAKNSVTFTNVPDLPLTSLTVGLNGGSDALFATTCNPSTGTAGAQFVDQNGDKTISDTAALAISGCAATTPPKAGKPTVKSLKLSGLSGGKPKLSFSVHAGNNGAPKVSSVTVKLPSGLSFVKAEIKKGVSVKGAKIKKVSLSGGKLTITLKSSVTSFSVKVSSKAIKESASLRTKAKKHKVKTEKVTVSIKDATGKKTSVTVKVKV